MRNFHSIFHSDGAQKFTFTTSWPILVICCLFHNSHSDEWMWTWFSLRSWVALPWWLVMLSIFSLVCQPFVCLLCKTVYWYPLPIFHSDYLVFWCWVLFVLYILCILTLYWVYHLQISFATLWVAFLFC